MLSRLPYIYGAFNHQTFPAFPATVPVACMKCITGNDDKRMNRSVLIGILSCLSLMACRQNKPIREDQEMDWYSRTFGRTIATLFRGSVDSAVYEYDSIAHTLKNPPRAMSFLRYDFMHAVHAVMNDNAKAVVYLDSAIGYLERNRLTTQYPTVYFGFLCRNGELALFQAKYNESYEYYLKAKQWAARHLTSCQIADYSYNLAMVLYRQQKYAESRNYFSESADQYTNCNRAVDIIAYKQQEIADNIGLCYVKTKQYDSALLWFNRALAIIEQNRDSLRPYHREMAQAVIWGNMAKVYVAQNGLDTAAHLFKKSIAVNARPGYARLDAQLVQAQLAQVYDRQNRYAEMFAVLQQLKKGLDTLTNVPAQLSWKELMTSYYQHTGQPLNELKFYRDYIRMRDSVNKTEENALKTDIPRQIKDREQELEIALLKKDNQLNKSYLVIAISLSAIAVLVVGFLYYIFRKTTRLNRLISAQKEELEQLNHVKNRLFSIISHDMRAPVSSLSSFIYLLEEGDISKASLLEYSYPLKKSLANTSAMMENLLNWAASQLQGFRPSVERAAIREIVEKAIANTAGSSEEKEITVINDIPAEILAGADRYMLQVVLRNLLSNAIKYSYPGGAVVVSAETGGAAIMIKIKDSGIGMAADQVRKINAATHVQVLQDTIGTAGEKGIGLGIYLCRTFVEMMKGSLQVESEPGKGTVFFIRLPV
jgi:signal transduction histidine kinase